VLSGHSLGGGLATAAAAVTGAPTAIYNAAGLNPLSLIHAGYSSAIPNIGRNIVSYSVGFEALTTGQHLLSAIAPTAGASNYYMYAPNVRSWKDFNPIELHRPDATLRSIN
jgi:copper oxidase (laccase) domain-containing protein